MLTITVSRNECLRGGLPGSWFERKLMERKEKTTEEVDKERRTCGAKTRGGEPCKKRPVRGCLRCRNHGARAGRPPVTGEYSRFFPPHLHEDFERGLHDQELLSLAFEIAACEARMSQLLRNLSQATPVELWQAARRLYGDAVAGTATSVESRRQLGEVLREGLQDVRVWEELGALFDSRRRLAQTEVIRLRLLEQFVDRRQTVALGTGIMAAMRNHLKDPEMREQLCAYLKENCSRLL